MRATQAVLQQREYEEGLVNCYRRYLETCEAEIKGKGHAIIATATQTKAPANR